MVTVSGNKTPKRTRHEQIRIKATNRIPHVSHVKPNSPITGRQRQLKILRTRALVADHIKRHGFPSPDNPQPTPDGVVLIPAPVDQLYRQANPSLKHAKTQQLYDGEVREVRSFQTAELNALAQHLHQNTKEVMRMRDNALWITPAIIGAGFLATLAIMLVTPTDIRPPALMVTLVVFAAALNTAIIPPISAIIIRYNQRMQSKRETKALCSRVF